MCVDTAEDELSEVDMLNFVAMLMGWSCHPRKIEKGKNPIVTDGGAMQRRTGETFVRWAKRINLEIHEEKSRL